jgi:hypothetical protein
MLAIMKSIGGIEKEKNNQTQNFKYRGIDQVYSAVHPLMIKHGVFMRAEILDKNREERTNKNGTVMAFTTLRMRYHFVAEDGSSICTEAEGEGMDSGDKSSNKAMSIAHKYAILQAFCVPTEQVDDPDAEVHEIAPEKQRGTKAAAQAVAERKLAELRSAAPSEIERQLTESISEVNKGKMIEIVQAFGELKKQLVAAQQESVYYTVLGLHGVKKSNEFKTIDEAKKCYRDMGKAVAALKGKEVIVNA